MSRQAGSRYPFRDSAADAAQRVAQIVYDWDALRPCLSRRERTCPHLATQRLPPQSPFGTLAQRAVQEAIAEFT